MKFEDRAKHTAGLFAFALRLENLVHEECPSDFPRATTKGHFGVEYTRLRVPWVSTDVVEYVGEAGEVCLKEGYDELDYDTVGDVPGSEPGESPDEVFVFVHGWLCDTTGSLGRLSMMRHSLREAGYNGGVIGFSWDTHHSPVEWKHGVEVARRNGPKLAQFLHDYKRANPQTDVRLISNSLGSEVLFSALSTLHSSGLDNVVSTATVLGGATDADAVCEGGRYAEGMGAADEVHNYWMEKDGTLNYLYRSVESEDAVGGTGSDDEPPDNYLDHEVRDVPDHYSYYRKSKGCVERFLSDVGAIS